MRRARRYRELEPFSDERILFDAGKAFRHGDIEDILSELAKTAGHAVGGGGLIGFAQSVLSAASGGAKFSKEDVKRVYFVSIIYHFTCFFLVFTRYTTGKLAQRLFTSTQWVLIMVSMFASDLHP